jgi:hypothetical protein
VATTAIISAALTVLLGCSTAYLWLRCLRLRRELAEARSQVDELGSIAALAHNTAYRLSCQIHGQASTDRAMNAARDKGHN